MRTASESPLSRARWQLVAYAAAALYLELAVIRFCAAEVLYLGYFSNFVLITSLMGLGLGFLAAGRDLDLGRHVPFALLFLFALVLVSEFDVAALKDRFGLFFFGNVAGRAGLPGALLLAVLFGVIVTLFAGLGNLVAGAFRRFPPLRAYGLDLVGSLAGIGLFSWHSLAASGPVTWVLTGSLLVILGHALGGDRPAMRKIAGVAAAAGCVAVLLLSAREGHPTLWSRYQKLELEEDARGRPANLFANGVFHQILHPAEVASETYYGLPYRWQLDRGGSLERVLIVGSGSGTDVAVALALGAQSVEAVEIDPGIVELGRRFHPDRPLDDPRVQVVVADGREVVRNADARYDLVVFALPDSLIRLSSLSAVRLESYLFTVESFREVRRILRDDGLFVLYNQYRWPWLVERIAATVEEAFGHPPHRVEVGPTTVLAVAAELAPGEAPGPPPVRDGFVGLPTDDWPFVYMQRPRIHWLYMGMIAGFLLASVAGVWLLAPAGTLRRPDGPFFFMGAAFLLLETKSLAFFSLLFGTTWQVNSMAFAGILASVLAANTIVQKWRVRRRAALFVALFGALAIAYLVPTASLLEIETAWLRYLAGVVLVFTPIFCANLVFCHEFRDTEESTSAFGWNLLGAVAGGGLEYLSLILGFRNLLWIVAGCYALTALLLARRRG